MRSRTAAGRLIGAADLTEKLACSDADYRHISCAPNRPFATIVSRRNALGRDEYAGRMSAADAHAADARRMAVVNVGRSAGVQDFTEGL